MFRSVSAAIIALMAVPAAAAEIPTYNVEPGCRASAARAVPVGDPQICITKENEARAALKKEWDKFAAADKTTCVPLSSSGGTPTYTELLTCLEMSRDARNLPADGSSTTTGQGSAGNQDSTRQPGRRR